MIINELFRHYAELKIKEKEVKAEIDELAPQIVDYMRETDIEKQPTTLGTFSLGKRKNWKYTSAVEIAEKRVKELQVDEQATGAATFTEKPYLLFTTPKDQNEGL